MIYLKSYCYSAHEIPFIIANLDESKDYVDYLVLYEYSHTHTGIRKDYNIEKYLDTIPENLRKKLIYKKIDISDKIEYAYEDGPLIHQVNEPLMRSWFFNDSQFKLEDSDIIIDIDIDEIIYEEYYPKLIEFIKQYQCPVSLALNQFFYKHTYLWTDCNFNSPTIYTYGGVKNISHKVKEMKILHQRDLPKNISDKVGCHLSWTMPIDHMIKKFESYSHPENRKYSDITFLKDCIKNKKYFADPDRAFDIEELNINDCRIPKILQKDDIFDYLN